MRGAFFRMAGVSSYNSAYDGQSVMQPVNDAVKRHRHPYTRSANTQSVTTGTATARNNSSEDAKTGPEIYDEATDTRDYEGYENRPYAISCNYAIKY